MTAKPETRIAPHNGEPTTALTRPSPNYVFAIRNVVELRQFADLYHQSGMAPKGMSAAAIAVAVQLGMELGLAPGQAVQSIAVINGRPSIWGPTAIALVEASGLLADIDIYFVEDGRRTDHPARWNDTTEAVCTTLRKGRKQAYTTRFSVADAKRAKLWGRETYAAFPQRMMRHRAVAHNLMDNFGDVLKGLDAGEQPDVSVEVIPPAAESPVLPPLSERDAADLRMADAAKALRDAGKLDRDGYAKLFKEAFGKRKRAELTADELNAFAATLEDMRQTPEPPPREPGDEGDDAPSGQMFPDDVPEANAEKR